MEERFEIYESLFEHPGWALFVKEHIVPAVRDVPKAAFENATSIEQIIAARIVRDKLAGLDALPKIIAAQKEEYAEQAEQEAQPEWLHD